MAWIESHQSLGGHPKTRKLAHLLGVSKPAAIGHLHCFWWWALDYAPEGDLSRYDALDVAIGAEWEGDPDTFQDAMITSGFIDADNMTIHDWHDYAGKLIERKKANAERMRKARAEHENPTKPAQNDTNTERAAHVHSTCENVRSDSTNLTNQPNQPDRTNQPTREAGADAPDVDVHRQRFDAFWSVYPKRVGKGAAEKWWRKRKPSQSLTDTMISAVQEQAKSDQWRREGGQFIPNPTTWLNQERWKDDVPAPQSNITPFQTNHRSAGRRGYTADELLAMSRGDP